MAQRANISPTWYTWLEQGRGGAPSADVLDRIAAGLMLTEPEREHLFMLGLGRPPEVRYRPVDGVTPRLQRVLDALRGQPGDHQDRDLGRGRLEPRRRRAADRLRAAAAGAAQHPAPDVRAARACGPRRRTGRASPASWWARSGPTPRAPAPARRSPSWSRSCPGSAPSSKRCGGTTTSLAHGEGVKRLHHPELGLLELEFSAFAVDGRPELGMIVYNPASQETAERMRTLIGAKLD